MQGVTDHIQRSLQAVPLAAANVRGLSKIEDHLEMFHSFGLSAAGGLSLGSCVMTTLSDAQNAEKDILGVDGPSC